jgi:hypothetical protein
LGTHISPDFPFSKTENDGNHIELLLINPI